MSTSQFSLALAPLLPAPALALACGLAAAAAVAGFLLRARGAGGRALTMGILAVALLNPLSLREEREPQADVAVIVVDESPSQDVGERRRQSAAALSYLERNLSRFDRLEVRVVRAGSGADMEGEEKPGAGQAEERAAAYMLPEDGTRLFRVLSGALADVPRERIAGAVLITDGQVHDAPRQNGAAGGSAGFPFADAPLHVLLTGKRGAGDRRLTVETAPRYGIVGQNVEFTLRLDEAAGDGDEPARLTVLRDGKRSWTLVIRPGESRTFAFPIDHAGANLFEFAVAEGDEELTLANNRAVAVVNGVRERLRVLLISGEPHAGERVWRNFLKSDPSLDLVHFTILRPPEKQDETPVKELSLITFPVRELFEEKLGEFDLVIFDRYRRRGLVPWNYLKNVVSYVRNGGALLEAAGPSFASPLSLFHTPLGDLLPGEPTGRIYERGYRPELTPLGRRHPVTAGLAENANPKQGAGEEGAAVAPAWGRWFRQIEVEARRGDILLGGAGGHPLLILDRFGKGRVAQLLSDHIWLWARGFEGGGPQAELLRRLAHWLMKEPELEENTLRAEIRGKRLEITRHSLRDEESPVTVTAPSGREYEVALEKAGGGRATASLPVLETGLYRLDDGKRGAIAAAGALNPLEYSDVRATPDLVKPAVSASGGGIFWIAEERLPEPRRVRPGDETFGASPADGRGWIGFLDHGGYIVTGVREVSLLPGFAIFLLALLGLILAWRREGQ